jgi:hypothetical protein
MNLTQRIDKAIAFFEDEPAITVEQVERHLLKSGDGTGCTPLVLRAKVRLRLLGEPLLDGPVGNLQAYNAWSEWMGLGPMSAADLHHSLALDGVPADAHAAALREFIEHLRGAE